jgi:hypothetical protein
MTIDDIIARLNEGKRRATYGAVGRFRDVPAQSVMKGRPRNRLNSWVVAKKNGRPTGYRDQDIHPDCLCQIQTESKRFISTAEALSKFLHG